MENANSLALLVAYYLSRHDPKSYSALGFINRTQALSSVGSVLGVKANTVKNMQDEFDSIHDNGRLGWHQRPLRPSRQHVVELFSDLSELELREIVLKVLSGRGSILDEVGELLKPGVEDARKNKGTFAPRGLTGKAAEEYFVKYHSANGEPVPGVLLDTRDLGCGYDFIIEPPGLDSVFVEVKGIKDSEGGVTFTGKEWETAVTARQKYYLAVVRNALSHPSIQFVSDPAGKLVPRLQLLTVVQTSWNLNHGDLMGL